MELGTVSGGDSGGCGACDPAVCGQGINQAFEDVFTYAVILGRVDRVPLQRALKIWQEGRQERVDRLRALNAQTDARRMPTMGGEKQAENEPFDLDWLYKPDFVEMVDMWLSKMAS